MSLFKSMNVAATGLAANRFKMDVISDNIANANTTRTTEGGPFKRSRVILRPRNDRLKYKSPVLPFALQERVGDGVKVVKVQKDQSEGRLIYDPTHPDAYQWGPKQGYVEFPNVNIVKEMADMINATRSYEANITLMNSSKSMFQRGLEIGLR